MTDFQPGGIIVGPNGDHYGEWTTSVSDLDPRWEWCEATTLGGHPEYLRGRCRHLPSEVVPVESGGDTVAHLCRTCDTQLPA